MTARRTETGSGVRAALTGQPTGPSTQAGSVGASTAVRITLAASYGDDLQLLADRVHHTVAEHVEELTGLHPSEVTVVIDDVLEPVPGGSAAAPPGGDR